MKLFSNKLFLGGLISCLILIVGLYFFTQSNTENFVISEKSREDSTDHVSTNREEILKGLADPWDVWIEKQRVLTN